MSHTTPTSNNSKNESKKFTLKQAELHQVDNLTDHLLRLRGIVDTGDQKSFLNPEYSTGIHDPWLLKDMVKVVDRISRAIEEKERILIYSDYDADGLPGAAVMHDLFKTLDHLEYVDFVTPDRHTDGFGVHKHIIESYIKSGTTLIITIDCGIADVESLDSIKKCSPGIDIIVTDHHVPGPVLPNVFAIINPKQPGCEYPEKMLCGAAVIWKVVCALVDHFQKQMHVFSSKFNVGYEKWLLDLVGISTLSDMVPLQGENRILAYYGLIVLRKTKRVGIRALLSTNNIEPQNIQEDDVTFTISPRINVASRLSEPRLAFDVLTAVDYDHASKKAKELETINTKRKTLVAQIVKKAMKLIADKYDTDIPSVIVIGNPDWKPPVLGLVATHIVKHVNRPAFVWGRAEDGVIKGSIRSVSNIDIVDILHKVPDEVFLNKGGHAQSGGFSLDIESVHQLEPEVLKAYDSLYANNDSSESSSINKLSGGVEYLVDSILEPVDIQTKTYQSISKLAPFGVGNEKPLFALRNMKIKGLRLFGKAKDHLEIDCGHFKVIQFFTSYSDTSKPELSDLEKSTFIGHLEKNQFRGASDIRFRLVDVI